MISRILLYSFAFLAVSYLVWHFGRYYEFKRILVQTSPAWYLVNPVLSDPIVNTVSDLFVSGDWAVGVCLPAIPFGL